MTKNREISLFKVLIIFLIVGWAVQACSPAQADPHSAGSTPSQDKYAEAFTTYAKQLEQEGLTAAKEIRVEESQPFIFILKPQSQEITDRGLLENKTRAAGLPILLWFYHATVKSSNRHASSSGDRYILLTLIIIWTVSPYSLLSKV